MAGPVGIGRVSAMDELNCGALQDASSHILQENAASELLLQEAWGLCNILCAVHQVTGDGCCFVKVMFGNASMTNSPVY